MGHVPYALIIVCIMQVCHHPRDKFHVNYNSRRHVFSWAKLKLMLGMGFGIKDDRMMKDIWKAFKPTCPNGHRCV